MQTRNRLLDDLARVAGSAAGVAAGLKDEVESRLRQQFERVLDGFELVDRDEFEAVKAMAAEARAENQRLAARIADLEAAQGGAKPRPKASSRPKATSSRTGKTAARTTTVRRKAAKKNSPGAP